MKMLINGEWVDASNGEVIEVFDPGNAELVDTVPKGTEEDLNRAVSIASTEGKKAMANMPVLERSEILKRIAELAERDADRIGRLYSRENGKPLAQAVWEVTRLAFVFREFGESAKRVFGRTFDQSAMPGLQNNFAYTIRLPEGVVAGIVPYNYSVGLFAWKAAPSLGAGNAFIAKLPSEAPLAVMEIAKIMLEAGVPESALHILTGPGKTLGEAMALHPEISHLTFTGGTHTGKRIMALCAKTIKRISMELGGNDPLIVFDDADLKNAAVAAVRGRLSVTSGQVCSATKRVLVQENVIDEYTNLVVEEASKLKLGYQLDEGVDVGPLISEEAAEKVEKMINNAIENGAKLLIGGKRHENYVEPTVLGNMNPDMEIFRTECFGPVLPLYAFKTEEEAVELANDSPYGLSSGVFTNDLGRAIRTAHSIEAGTTNINSSGIARPGNIPFKGFKQSGMGGGEDIHTTLMEFSIEKGIQIYNVFGK